ncbi:MAG: EF-P lysine aminoacylase GenX [Desulfamplus sp.]|nr:EF-P lysine aminoacylase GenX [Desulfamplus sp.]
MLKQLVKRAEMIRAIREFFYNNGYLEVETPLRVPNPIPEEHIEPFESEGWYLQSSPEICMKRLAAQGYGKIFQICKCFRKDERGDRHLTELTMVEWYRKDYSYIELMQECKEMIRYVARKLLVSPVASPPDPSPVERGNNYSLPLGRAEEGQNSYLESYVEQIKPENVDELKKELFIEYGNHTISINSPWQYITVSEAFEKYGSMTMEEAEKRGSFDEIMSFEIEPNLGLEVPTFIYDYPSSMASLAKLKSNNINLDKNENGSLNSNNINFNKDNNLLPEKKSLAERFELYIAGIELANGFSELNDPVEQRERLLKVIKNRAKDKKNMELPEKFLQDLAKLPKTAGIALGVDRLAMVFTNSSSIDDVVAFTSEEL